MPLAGVTWSTAVVFSIIQQKDKFWLIDVPEQQVCFEKFVSKPRQKCTGQLKKLCRGNFRVFPHTKARLNHLLSDDLIIFWSNQQYSTGPRVWPHWPSVSC